jgi:nucleotide-binding universal stress UspA family protein
MKAGTQTCEMKTPEIIKTRIDIKNVLVTTDFSPAGSSALPYAAEMAKRFGAKLFVLHVRPPSVNPMTQPAAWEALAEAAKAEIEVQKEQLRKSFPGIKPVVFVQEGDMWNVLSSTIDQNNIDLLVVGTRGRTGVRKFFLGSVAEEIFRQAPCPVLTIGPFSPGEVRNSQISEILYATDFGPASGTGAAYAVSLAQEFQARLTLLHVIPEPKTGDLVIAAELKASAENRLRKLVPPEAELWCEPRYMVEEGPTAETILEVANCKKSDLVVLGVHQPAGFPGASTHLPNAIAHKVVSHASCPVLTVHS